MPTTKYNSTTKSKSDARGKEISQFAQDSFEAVRLFINIYDCGVIWGENPIHLITKETWRLNDRRKAGERNLLFENGNRFIPYLDILRNIFSPEHVHNHIEEHQTTYYTSGNKGFGLLYLDVDAHHPWQTDEYRAKAVLQKLFPFGYFRASGRGQNGYLKIRYPRIAKFNEAADHLQATLKRLFLHLGILCDVETKGTITFNDKSGRLAKLPFNCKPQWKMRDETDNWNRRELNKFKECPVVSIQQVEYVIGRLENRFDEEKVERFAKYKKSLEDQEREKQGKKPKNLQKRQSPQQKPEQPSATPALAATRTRQAQTPQPTAAKPGAKVERTSPCTVVGIIALDPPSTPDDAFVRNQEDIRPFVRAFYCQHRRFPTVAETLDWMKQNGRYSGDWEDRENKRAKRVGQVLAYTEQNFDPKMLSSSETKPVSLDVRKFYWWVRQQVGSVMAARFFN